MQSAAHHMGGACYLHATGMHKLTLDHAVLIPDLSRSVKNTALHNNIGTESFSYDFVVSSPVIETTTTQRLSSVD